MGLILLEALLAGLIFVVIVWWTMFSGRKKGELPQAQLQAKPQTDQTSAATDEVSPAPTRPPR